MGANYRSGSLVQGQAFPNAPLFVTLITDNQVINVTTLQPPCSTIYLRSNSTTQGARTFTLSNSTITGQALTLIFSGDSQTTTCQLVSSSNCVLSEEWRPLLNDVLHLEWNGTAWVETFRSKQGFVISGQLTNTQVKSMSTPIEVIPAPGAGKAIIIDQLQMFYNRVQSYTGVNGVFGLRCGTAGPVQGVTLTTTGRNFLLSSTSMSTIIKPATYTSTATNTGLSLAFCVNKNISFRSDGVLGGGNAGNYLAYKINYRVITVQA